MSKILLFGCYTQGNFGDDLMAIFFSKLLEQCGHDVTAYKLPYHLSTKYKIKSCSNILKAVNEVEVIVLGGGALIKNGITSHGSVKKLLEELLYAINLKTLPIYCVSIGSSGLDDLSQLDSVRRDIFMSNNFKGGLVRLKKDIDLFDGKVEYVPDIVLCTRLILERYFKYIQNKAGKGSIINATWSNLSDVLSLFRDLNIFNVVF